MDVIFLNLPKYQVCCDKYIFYMFYFKSDRISNSDLFIGIQNFQIGSWIE
jgi:hypothetical protein